MSYLLKRKPLDMLMREASRHGEHSLKRALGPVNLVMLWALEPLSAREYSSLQARPRHSSLGPVLCFLLHSGRDCLLFCGTLLCRIRSLDSDRGFSATPMVMRH